MLRLGIVGCGRVTTMFHLKAIKEVEEVTVVAVADRNQYRMQRVRKKAGAERGYIDYRELLSDPEVDAVVVNTPPCFHEEMVIGSLEAGKHVMCEKPLARRVEGCLHIKQVQESTGFMVLPAHNYAFTPSLEKAQDLIGSGEIGNVEGISLRFENHLKSYRSKTDFRLQTEFGIVEDILPHILPVAHGLAGTAEKIIDIREKRKSYDVVDNMNIVLGTDRGVELDCFMSWTKLIPSFKVKATCTSGAVETDLMKSPYSVAIESGGVRRKIDERKGLKLYLGLLRFKHPSFQNQYRHLCRMIDGSEKPRITIDDEVDIIRMMEEVEKHLFKADTL